MPEVIYEKGQQKLPIKVWGQKDQVDAGTLEQALNMANLPFAYKWPALMPDFHKGYGMPIGGVLATQGVILPNAVGVDIGCGMGYVQTNIPAKLLREVVTGGGATLAQVIIGAMMRSIPVGFAHHKEERPELWDEKPGLESELEAFTKAVPVMGESQESRKLENDLRKYTTAFGTLGGGNHFIELQEDSHGNLGIMIHTGSRSLGAAVHKAYNDKAKVLNERYFSSVPTEWGLSFLPVDTQEGKEYIAWMNMACAFAKESRREMLGRTVSIVFEQVSKHMDVHPVQTELTLDVHHNYAAIEHHFGKNVWVHRKGAIRARNGEQGIIPGAMGSFSYLVMGKGNEDAFHSASHGAGRVMSRTQAKKTFTVQEVVEDSRDFVLGKHKKDDVAEEYKGAYKDIDEVLANETDLVLPVKKLQTVAVLKG